MQTPKARTTTNFLLWYLGLFLPRRLVSSFVRRVPEVYCFGNDELGNELRDVNVWAPTRMCCVMTMHGSDKGRRWHNYTRVYSKLLLGRQNEALRIFELGLGTNNPDLVSTMGNTGRPGASLRGWRDLFPNAQIFGADIDRTILFEEPRIKTFYCDQLDQEAIGALWARPELRPGIDILIEDGLHTLQANTTFLECSLQYVNPGGFYAIEDIGSETIGQWRKQLSSIYAKQYPDYEFALLVLPNCVNQQDNNMLIARRWRRQ